MPRTFNGGQIVSSAFNNGQQLDASYVTLNTTQTVNGTKIFKNILVNSNYIPNNQNSPGVSGQIAFNNSFLFVCLSGDGTTNGDWRAIAMGGDWS